MEGELLQFGASLLAVLALVALAYAMGFRQQANLESEAEAIELFRLAPGGFEPVTLALDSAGKGAIARDAEGRLAVLVPHGTQFVARTMPPATAMSAWDGVLTIAGDPPLSLDLGETAGDWAATDIAANNA